ncbi:MAG: hypothetical protein AB7F22_15400 [Reyranella sp.]|uniref:hypothetical protein n=1 Tax=Reyranella sp. TaxID=1929291 RepID=UPI003D0BAE3F
MTDPISDDDILRLARLAGLELPAEYRAELIEAYGHVRAMIERLPGGRPHGDEPAHVFVPTAFRPKRT